jgi:glycosyltransferase involved in cell wall biosynthesis
MKPSGVENRPLVSILTPSFNQAEYIGDALQSVACQTYPRIEHIVMDGGSSDSTVDVLKSAGPSITWRSESDRGQCDALNKAFRLANGDIIGWVNSDDAYFDCGVVQRVVDAFLANPRVDVVYGHAVRTAADGRIVWVIWTPRFNYRLMRRMNFLVQPTVFIRRSALPDFLVDEAFDFTMDWELWLRLGRNLVFKRLDSVLAIDRHQPGRKNKTAIEVFEENERRLAPLYGVGRPPYWRWTIYHRFYSLRQRFCGGLLVHRIANTELAFRGRLDSEDELWRRQVVLRHARWAREDAEAW